jgi:hypothetical protein
MGFKFEFSLSREAFDGMLAVIGSLLLECHILPKSSFVHLTCRMSRYMLVRRGASYLGKNTRMQITVQSVNPPGTRR